jgi:hypothetical protein
LFLNGGFGKQSGGHRQQVNQGGRAFIGNVKTGRETAITDADGQQAVVEEKISF